jgi:hypothetical protein
MPKVEEFYHIYNKKMERHAAHTQRTRSAPAAHTQRKRVRCASETIILGILDHFKF